MPILNDCIDDFLVARVGEISTSTIDWYKSHLTTLAACLGERDITTITLTDLRRYRANLIQGQTCYNDHPKHPTDSHPLSVHTVRGKIRAVKGLFSWLVAEGVIESSPAARLKAPKKPKNEEPKAIPDADIRKMHNYAVNHEMPREAAIIHLLADTGARVAGIANLKRTNVDTISGIVTVTEKGEKTRQCYLSPAGLAAVRAYLRERPCVDHNYLLVGRTGAPLSTSGIRQALQRLADATGVQRCNPHAFRHAYAREMLEAGVDLKTLSDLMGHSSIVVTADNYTIWAKKELEKKAREATRRRRLWKKAVSEQ